MSEIIKKPEGAELFHEGLWFKQSQVGGYAEYWNDIKKMWMVSASMSNAVIAIKLANDLTMLNAKASGEIGSVYCRDVRMGTCTVASATTPAFNIDMKFDHGKPRYDLLPPIAIDEMAKVMTFGANKYEAHSWKTVKDAEQRFLSALLRHAFALVRGEALDSETKLHHASHIMCNAAFLVELSNDQ